MSGDSALVLMQDVSCYGRCRPGAVGELAALSVKGKPANYAPRLYAHVRTCTCNMYTDIPWRWKHTELKHSEMVKFNRISYFITPFNQKGIHEWESKCWESKCWESKLNRFSTSGLNPPRPGS